MPKISHTIAALTLLMLMVPCLAADEVVVYFFWSNGCPHCANEKVLLEDLKNRYPGLQVMDFEVSTRENIDLYMEMAEAYGFKPNEVPTIFIGDQYITSYSQSKGNRIEAAITECVQMGSCPNPIERLDMTVTTIKATTTTFVNTAYEKSTCNSDSDCASRHGTYWICIDNECSYVPPATTTTTRSKTTTTRKSTTTIRPTTTIQDEDMFCPIGDTSCGSFKEDKKAEILERDQNAYMQMFLLIAAFCAVFLIVGTYIYFKKVRNEDG